MTTIIAVEKITQLEDCNRVTYSVCDEDLIKLEGFRPSGMVCNASSVALHTKEGDLLWYLSKPLAYFADGWVLETIEALKLQFGHDQFDARPLFTQEEISEYMDTEY